MYVFVIFEVPGLFNVLLIVFIFVYEGVWSCDVFVFDVFLVCSMCLVCFCAFDVIFVFDVFVLLDVGGLNDQNTVQTVLVQFNKHSKLW